MSGNNENLVVVKKFYSTTEAMVVKALLDSQNIDSELVNETMADLFPGNPSEEFQVKLLARSEDVDKINAVLDAKFNQSELTDEFK